MNIHRVQANLFPVNAYLIETPSGIVAVDATLGVSDGQMIRARAQALGKPLLAALVTHSHPDHYGGLTSLLGGDDIPVYAVNGVADAIRRDDAAKEEILRPMFGDEWARTRTFPNRTVVAGERVVIGDTVFTAVDLGPGESPYDSLWRLESSDAPRVFVGDLVYNRMHAYLADGFAEEWLANLRRVRGELPADAVLYMGHGQPSTGLGLLDDQAAYLEHFLEALRESAAEGLEGDGLADAVTARMKRVLPTDDLLFLLRLSVEPMRARMAGARS